MRTQYIENTSTPGVCIHNTAHWQVAELMGGLACELLYKRRLVTPGEQADANLSTHDCYPSLFMQGDEASDFLAEISAAQARMTGPDIDRLLLDAYTDVMN